MCSASFFEESKEQSKVKSQIVSKYFTAWANVVSSVAEKIAYVDLFSGPGAYKKEQIKSTPILVLEKAIQDTDMQKMLITIFNDKNKQHIKSLKNNIASIPDIGNLKHQPQFFNEEIGENIIQILAKYRNIPMLLFADPYGYRGLSLHLINTVLQNWGSDCIFFFNYNRINPGLNNKSVKQHMDALFGEEAAEKLRKELAPMKPFERELKIIEAIRRALKDLGGKFVLPFCFKKETRNRTSHYLIFVSKHITGHNIMKDIMAKASSSELQGVPSFEYNKAGTKQYHLELYCPLDELEKMLLKDLAGRTMTMKQIYEEHNIEKNYIESNYKTVLAKLEEAGKIVTEPFADKRQKRKGIVTFGPNVKVTFPKT